MKVGQILFMHEMIAIVVDHVVLANDGFNKPMSSRKLMAPYR